MNDNIDKMLTPDCPYFLEIKMKVPIGKKNEKYCIGKPSKIYKIKNETNQTIVINKTHYYTSNETTLVYLKITTKINQEKLNFFSIRSISSNNPTFPYIYSYPYIIRPEQELYLQAADGSGSKKPYYLFFTLEGLLLKEVEVKVNDRGLF